MMKTLQTIRCINLKPIQIPLIRRFNLRHTIRLFQKERVQFVEMDPIRLAVTGEERALIMEE